MSKGRQNLRSEDGRFISRRNLSIIAVVSLLLLSLVAFTSHLSVNSFGSSVNPSSIILCGYESTTTTKLSASTINLGESVTDNVTVTGSHGTPTGTVTFQVKFDAGSWVTYDTKSLSGGKATSNAYTPSSAGQYWFRAIYGGNGTYVGSQSCDTSEPLCVNPTPKHDSTTSTQLSASTINLGESVTDNVTVTGSFGTPTGSVIFQVKFNGGSWTTYDNENLVNGKATSKPYTPSSTGNYWFMAIYSGDNNYENSQSLDDSEPLTVNPTPPHNSNTSTQLSASTINLGDSVTDSATVTGSFGTPTGTVTFQVKLDGGGWASYDTENLVNGMATSIAYVPSQAGNYWFRAIYSGDSTYNGSQSGEESEPLTVNPRVKDNSTTSTQLSISMITLGDNVTDTATVTGLVSPLPTGTIDFQVKIDGGLWTTYDTENLSGGTATSVEYVPLVVENYWFRAIYSGDENYNGSTSPDDNEPLMLTKFNFPEESVVTELSESTITLGENVIDTVTVTGLPNPPYPLPTGTVDFQVKFDGGAWVTYDTENLVNGTATSIEYVPLAAGDYWFRALYSGDSNYTEAQSDNESEPLTVNKHETTTVTELSESEITLGENVTDTVTVTGLVSPLPTGTVDFQVKFDGGSWVTYDTENLSGGTATSSEYSPLVPGTYWFMTIYSGDNNYYGSQSDNESEPLMVPLHGTTTVTELLPIQLPDGDLTITLGDSVIDTVTVTGLVSPLPTGTVTFQVKFDDGSWVTYDTETLVNGMASSIVYTPLVPGQYWFQAIYSGDNNYYGSQSDNESEPLTVNKHETTTTTELSAGTITLGENVMDTATVTGMVSPLPTGVVDFQVKFDDGSWISFDNQNLSGGTATSIVYTPLAVGQYWFRAVYSGDDNYYGSQSPDESEPLTVKENENEPLWVNKGPSTTTTLLSASTIIPGDNVTDTVIVTGLGGPFPVPTGSVTFQVKFDDGSWVTYDTETLVNGMATSIEYTPPTPGQYWFRAIYGGDNNYENSQSPDDNEPLLVTKHDTTTMTELSESEITLGENVTDTVTVTGLVSPLPTGTVDFQVRFDGGSWSTYDTETLVNGMATSIEYTPLAAGQYWFRAIYSGDNYYENSQSSDNDEPLMVNKFNIPEENIVTELSENEITLGDGVTDTVTVTGLGLPFSIPTGTVDFQVKFDNGGWVTYDTETLVNGMATSIEYTPLAAGQYWFRALYSGDDNYYGSQSSDESEPLMVNPHDTTTTTELSAGEITLGENVTDTVTVTGLGGLFPTPTGTVNFQVKFDDGSWGTYDTETLVNGMATSIEYVPLQAGDYWFRAIYSGDNNYNGSQSGDESEPLTVYKHETTTITELSSREITLGDGVTDTVTVIGLVSPLPTGTVDFQVKFDNGGWVTYDTENLVNGMATSIEYTPLAAGQYWFRAIYSGDNYYYGSQSGDESEPLWVNKHDTTTTTLLSASIITLGESVTDNAYVTTGLPNPPYPLPTGTITFQVKFDGGSWVTFDIENLVNGMATSIPYVPQQAGQYYFRAIYSGDDNYNGSQSS